MIFVRSLLFNYYVPCTKLVDDSEWSTNTDRAPTATSLAHCPIERCFLPIGSAHFFLPGSEQTADPGEEGGIEVIAVDVWAPPVLNFFT